MNSFLYIFKNSLPRGDGQNYQRELSEYFLYIFKFGYQNNIFENFGQIYALFN